VSKWYDQSGNSNTAAQTTTADMPKIYDGTTGVVTENGKPTLEFNASSSTYGLNTASIDVTPGHLIIVTKFDSTTTNNSYCIGATSSEGLIKANGASPNISYAHEYTNSGDCAYEKVYRNSTNLLQLSTTVRTGFTGLMEQQNLFFTDDATANNVSFRHIGKNATNNATRRFSGTIQEVVVYNSDQSSFRTNIEDNINTFYSIY